MTKQQLNWTKSASVRAAIYVALAFFVPFAIFAVPAFAHFTSGALGGYLLVTLAESYIHDHVHHARKSFRRTQQKFPRLLNVFYQAFRSHTLIHHAYTYNEDHVTQFSDGHHKARVTEMLADKYGSRIISEDYGRTIDFRSALFFVVPLCPAIAPVVAFAKVGFTVGYLIPVVIYPLMSMLIHPYLHMRYSDAINSAPPWLKIFLKSAYMRLLWRHHWLHHRYPRHNFNLLLGGDLLRGVHKFPTASDFKEMSEVGIPTH